MSSQTLPPPQGPEYTPCGCGHIEPEHQPDDGPCLICDCQSYRRRTPLPAAGGVVSAAPDQADVERVAAALREHYLCTNRDEADADGNMPCRCGDWREPGPMGSDEDDWDAHLAEVALSVLPPPAARAAVLLWAADHLAAMDPVDAALAGQHAWKDAANELRRLAAEARQQPDTETEPESCAHCGTAIRRITGTLTEWWVHTTGGQAMCQPWQPARSARATPQPAAGARQDGAQTEADNPRAVCVCGHTRGEHIRIGGPFGQGRLLCDSCDPDSTDNLVCKEFEAL